MIELIQVAYSPYCIVQRRILEYSRQKFKITNIPVNDRSLIWKLSRERYYQVPLLRDGTKALFETDGNSQVISKYLDTKFELGLFPVEFEGVQSIIWRHIENELEGVGFKLNDIHFRKFIPARDHAGFVRHKERKFGRGCIDAWAAQAPALLAEFDELLRSFEQMLVQRPFLMDQQPRFVDFNLFGIIGNYLYSGHYSIPAAHSRLLDWHRRMSHIKIPPLAREKLHS